MKNRDEEKPAVTLSQPLVKIQSDAECRGFKRSGAVAITSMVSRKQHTMSKIIRNQWQ